MAIAPLFAAESLRLACRNSRSNRPFPLMSLTPAESIAKFLATGHSISIDADACADLDAGKAASLNAARVPPSDPESGASALFRTESALLACPTTFRPLLITARLRGDIVGALLASDFDARSNARDKARRLTELGGVEGLAQMYADIGRLSPHYRSVKELGSLRPNFGIGTTLLAVLSAITPSLPLGLLASPSWGYDPRGFYMSRGFRLMRGQPSTLWLQQAGERALASAARAAGVTVTRGRWLRTPGPLSAAWQ